MQGPDRRDDVPRSSKSGSCVVRERSPRRRPWGEGVDAPCWRGGAVPGVLTGRPVLRLTVGADGLGLALGRAVELHDLGQPPQMLGRNRRAAGFRGSGGGAIEVKAVGFLIALGNPCGRILIGPFLLLRLPG